MTAQEVVAYAATTFAAMFSIINPIGGAITFSALTQGQSAEERRRTARKSAGTCTVTLLTFLVAGRPILGFFGITVPAFRIAGGLLVASVAFHMLSARTSPVKLTPDEHSAALVSDEVAYVPLGIPLLSGPGAITTTILLSQRADATWQWILVAASIVAVTLLTYILFLHASRLVDRLGITGIKIATRLIGILLAVIGVQFVLDGLAQVAPTIFRNAHGM
ncbi:MAG: NAAT family transporter [Planctomycetes bacterium]|nr:NAAT family transporter [Planctomycetota bacterium]